MARIKICDICGDKGYMQHIVTCHCCKRASQHLYCMQVRLHEFPDIWYCDTCLPQASEVREGKMPKSCVKNECETKESPHLNDDGSHIICHRRKQKFRKLKFVMLEEIASTHRARSCYGTANSVAPNYHDNHAKDVCPAPPGKNPASKENVPPLGLLMNLNEEVVNCPLPKACWKGDFEIFGMASYIYSEIQAHFPSKVYHKAYEIAEKMPVKLKLNMLPRQDAWPFKSSLPNNYDIGLYFFASQFESSRQNYFQLLEQIDLCDLVLQAWIEDVELLIYPSKQLKVATHRIGGEAYLWGVFWNRKRRTNHLDMLPSSAAADTKMNARGPSIIVSEGSNQEVDMEIDMEGGKEVGKVDIPAGIADAPPGFPFRRPISCKVDFVSRTTDAAPGFPLVRPISCAPGFQLRRIPCEAGPVYRPADEPQGFLSRRPIKWEASSPVFNPADATTGFPLQKLLSCETSPVCMPANAHPGFPLPSPDTKPLAMLPLFPQEAEFIKVGVKDDCKTNQIVSADLSLTRPSYVMNHNVWVPRASTAADEDGCEELPLKL